MNPYENVDFRIEPVGERLVVRRITEERRGRMLMTEGSKDLGTEAEVVAVPRVAGYWEFAAFKIPDDFSDFAIGLSPGDRIFISRFVGVPVDIDGIEDHQLVIIKAEDVLGIKRPMGIADERQN